MELEVVIDLIMKGAMQHVDAAMIEFHTSYNLSEKERVQKIELLKETLKLWQQLVPKPEMVDLDDESYTYSKVPLPKCRPVTRVTQVLHTSNIKREIIHKTKKHH